MKEWFTSNELAGLAGMSKYASNVTRKAKSQGWRYRQIEGLKGVNYEYHVSSLPKETLAALDIKLSSGENSGIKNESISNSSSAFGDNSIDIALYEVKGKTWSKTEISTRFILPLAFFSPGFSALDKDDLFALQVTDSSMQPTLTIGEYILAKKVKRKDVISNGIYLIETTNGLAIRRLKPNLAGSKIKVCCDSEKFDDEELSFVDFHQSVKIIARSIFFMMKPIA
ncbi:hypothetical protein GWZ48_004391 [Vibrio fluvialis]|nr:hypothetical protein [Vibrio fluvialis]